MLAREQDMVIPVPCDCEDRVAEGNKIDDILVFVDRAFDADANSIVVSMQTLANVPRERNEMSSGKDKRFFMQIDTVRVRLVRKLLVAALLMRRRIHKAFLFDDPVWSVGKSAVDKRTNKPAAIKSAVVPGFNRFDEPRRS